MTATGNPRDPQWFRTVLGRFPTGVVVVTAMSGQGPVGMAVGSFTSVSLDPPMVAFLPDRRSRTAALIREAGTFCVNVLSAEQAELCRRFAASGADKFAGVAWQPAEVSGAPRLAAAVAWIDCDVAAVHDAGDHHIVVGDVRGLGLLEPGDPLLFYQGGYGRFSSLSLTTRSEAGSEVGSEAGMGRLMRQIEVVRPRMEEVAAELDMEAVAVARLESEMLIVASARTAEVQGVPTRVGQRIPMVPPLGAVLVAWADESVQDRWLDAIPPGGRREDYVAVLERVRARGWSLGFMSEPQAEFFEAVHQLSLRSPTEEQRARVAQASARVRLEDSEPADLDALDLPLVRIVAAPVFDTDRSVAFSIGLLRPRRMDRAEIEEALARILETAAGMTADLAALPDRLEIPVTARG
jgi:flavin reductase (DIM6/NTAB) family NADH-FMN oxidoreductase RutF/DNA-binding IclR family transcriptional regulator